MTHLGDGIKFRAITDVATGSERSIGALLIDSGKITVEDAERILLVQRETGLKFGEAAVKLGLVSEDMLQQVLSSQFEYPYLCDDASGVSRELIAAYEPFRPQVEQLRVLRSQLMLRWLRPGQNTLCVVSPARREGRSYVAANLAVAFSQLGEHTLLMDADLRNPRQHKLFNLSDRAGLSTFLAGRSGQDHIRRIPGLLDLSVLPAGPTPPNPQELLSRGVFQELIKGVGSAYDVVVVDTSASGLSADVHTVAARTAGTLLVARKNKTATTDLRDLAEAAVATGAKIVGTVLNDY